MMKPEQEVFEHLLSRYQLVASETAFVDDHPPNVEGARELGLHGILFRGAEQCGRTLEALHRWEHVESSQGLVEQEHGH